MRKEFQRGNDVLREDVLSRLLTERLVQRGENNLIRSRRFEDQIFEKMYSQSRELHEFRERNRETADSPFFYELLRSVFLSFYSVRTECVPQAELSDAMRFGAYPVLESEMKREIYPQIQKAGRGREVSSFLGALMFLEKMQDCFQVLSQKTPERWLLLFPSLYARRDIAADALQREIEKGSGLKEKRLVHLANRLNSLNKQICDLRAKLEERLVSCHPILERYTGDALSAAYEKILETSTLLDSFGIGEGSGLGMEENKGLFQTVRENPNLLEISRLLGKYRQITARKRANDYYYGIGEKYDMESGNNIFACLPTELAFLAVPGTQPLFLKKYAAGELLQYKARTPIVKGDGDKIVCIDESGSTRILRDWAKAFALAIVDMASQKKRKCAVIHFSSADEIHTDLFSPGKYTPESLLRCAQHFFGGGTNFESPLRECLQLLDCELKNAEILFITDGRCRISSNFAELFAREKQKRRIILTSILLDGPDGDKAIGESLLPFSDQIYYSSDMVPDEIAADILGNRT